MKLLTRKGQRELSFILGKMLQSIPDPRGSWEGGVPGRALWSQRYPGFCSDQLHIPTRPPWKRSTGTNPSSFIAKLLSCLLILPFSVFPALSNPNTVEGKRRKLGNYITLLVNDLFFQVVA